MAFRQDPAEFISNAFAADLMDFRGHCTNGIPCPWLNPVIQPRAKPNSSQNPEFVFLESRERIADGSNDFGIDICAAIDVIEDFAGQWVIQQSVDREIPTQDILLRISENHAAWPPAIDVSFIGTECGDLEGMAAMNHQ